MIWSVCFLSRVQMLWVRARLLSNVRSSVLKNRVKHFSTHEIWKQIDTIMTLLVSVYVLYAAHGIEQQTMLNPYMRYISEDKNALLVGAS